MPSNVARICALVSQQRYKHHAPQAIGADLRIQRNELAEPLLESEASGRRLDRHGINRVLSWKAQKVV